MDFYEGPVFIGRNQDFLKNFKKCRKSVFFEGVKKSFFVMGKRGRFSAKPIEEKDFGFRTKNWTSTLYSLDFIAFSQNGAKAVGGADFGKY
jgi:hypothetical protein